MYWLVSLPLLDSEARTWDVLQKKTTFGADLSINYKYTVPSDLKLGTLDSLLALSDDLVKVNGIMESVVNKIRRQLFDMHSGNADDREELLVEGMPPDSYLERFSWDEAKYPPRRPLAETVAIMSETVQKLDDDLKFKVSEYNQVRAQLNAAARKQTGSLAVRDLSQIVKPEVAVETENLTTLFVVVPKSLVRDWLSVYENLCEFVVPRSSKQVYEDNDAALFTVILFKKVQDQFKHEARSKGFQVRDYSFDSEASETTREAAAHMKTEAESKRQDLEQWGRTAYGEAFSSWIHICAIRLFVESILRYGLPPQFLGVLMKPNMKNQQKLRRALAATYGSTGTTKYYDGAEGAAVPAEGEMYPYVSFSISIDG